MNKRDPSLEELINLDDWKKIQDNFPLVTGIGVHIVNTEGDTVLYSIDTKLCSEVIKDSVVKQKFCGEKCLPTFLGGKGIVDRNMSFYCTPGLHNFIAPLRFEKKKVLGYIIMGPMILVMCKTKECYRPVAEELNVGLDELWSALLELRVISVQAAEGMIELVQDVVEFILDLTYKNIVKEKMTGPRYDIHEIGKLVNLLFNVACEITGADIGSAMTLNPIDNELSIQVSKGIPEEFTRNKRIRVGQGIAGIAAKDGVSFLIDKDTRDNRLTGYLRRPNIGSSMVFPLKIEDTTIGVINLGTFTTSVKRFDQDTMGVMSKLVELATVAFHK